MRFSLPPICILAFEAILGTAVLPRASRAQDYTLELMAVSGVLLTTIDDFVTINDEGICGFTARDGTNISRGYVVNGPVAAPIVMTTLGSATRAFQGCALNNRNPREMVIQDHFTGSPESWFIRRWSIVGGNPTFVTAGRSTTLTGPPTFESATPFVDINDNNKVAFSGFRTGLNGIETALFATDNFTNAAMVLREGNHLFRPQISNNNRIVFRDVLPAPLNENQIVDVTQVPGLPRQIHAGICNGFNSVHSMPGISHDGRVVAFIGNRGSGDGVFVSLTGPPDCSSHVFRIAGEGSDTFTHFDVNQRVAIENQGPAGASPLVTVVFMGTRGGVPGIYVVYASIVTGSLPIVSSPNLVAQAGTMVGGFTIESAAPFDPKMSLNDPLNRCGQVAFHAKFDGGSQGVVRATRRAPPVRQIRVAAKRVLGPTGDPAPNWITGLEAVVHEASSRLELQANVKLLLEEVTEVPTEVAGTSLFDVNSASIPGLEISIKAAPAVFAWRADSINIYFCNSITSGAAPQAGVCSFPLSTNPCPGPAATSTEIVFMALDACSVVPTISGMADVLAHELGHYFNLSHTFESCAGSEAAPPLPHPWASPLGGAYQADNACIAGDFVADTPTAPFEFDPGVLTTWYGAGSASFNILIGNLMSYYCNARTLTQGQVARVHQSIDLFRRSAEIGSGDASINILGPGGPYVLGGGFEPRLDITPPRLGQNLTIAVRRAPPSKPGFLFMSDPVLPAGYTVLSPCCTAYLDIPSIIVLQSFTTDAAGVWTVTFPLSNNPVLSGVSRSLQADIAGGSGYLGWYDFTSGILATFGN